MGGRGDGEIVGEENVCNGFLLLIVWDNNLEKDTVKIFGLGLGRKTIGWFQFCVVE